MGGGASLSRRGGRARSRRAGRGSVLAGRRPSARAVPSRRLVQELRAQGPGPAARRLFAQPRRRQRRRPRALLHVPAQTHRAAIPYDHWQGESPYEERPVLDEGLFASLPERAARYQRDWPFAPLLPAFWHEVLRQRAHTPLLGERLAAARRSLERRWGCVQAEVPLSRLCQGEAFAWFACHLLLHARRLREVYNGAVHEYRRRYGLRSVYHPVPDLAEEDDWCEVPLWAWQIGQRRRARLFVRQVGGALQLRAGDALLPALTVQDDPQRLVARWLELELRGYKVRTRALHDHALLPSPARRSVPSRHRRRQVRRADGRVDRAVLRLPRARLHGADRDVAPAAAALPGDRRDVPRAEACASRPAVQPAAAFARPSASCRSHSRGGEGCLDTASCRNARSAT